VNLIATVSAEKGDLTYLEIEVDGKLLAHHFVGRRGAHPSQLSPLGWSSESAESRADRVAQFLTEKPSDLASGRVPVLVCEECGDVGCGAYTVRIFREADRFRWTDWSYENGYEPERPLEWPTQPGDLVFDLSLYEAAIRRAQ
jgi:hypothetical protein